MTIRQAFASLVVLLLPAAAAAAPLEVTAVSRPKGPPTVRVNAVDSTREIVCLALNASGEARCSQDEHLYELTIIKDGAALAATLVATLTGETVLDQRRLERERQGAFAIADSVLFVISGRRGTFADSQLCFTRKSGASRSIHCGDWAGGCLRQIVPADSININPDLSPDRRKLVYVSYRRGNPDLWLRDIGSGNERRIASGDSLEAAPAFSPDGRQIAFASARNGSTNIFTVNVDGSDTQAITKGPQIDISPAWGGDGSLYYVSDRTGSPQIYRLKNGESRRLTVNGKYNIGPSVGPSGALVYARQGGGGFRLHQLNAAGEAHELAPGHSCEGPRFSPDGRLVAAACGGEITIIRSSDGSIVHKNGPGLSPAWR